MIETLNVPFQKIGLTETWLNENNIDCFTMNNLALLEPIRGVGVGIHVSKQLEYTIWSFTTSILRSKGNIEDKIWWTTKAVASQY